MPVIVTSTDTPSAISPPIASPHRQQRPTRPLSPPSSRRNCAWPRICRQTTRASSSATTSRKCCTYVSSHFPSRSGEEGEGVEPSPRMTARFSRPLPDQPGPPSKAAATRSRNSPSTCGTRSTNHLQDETYLSSSIRMDAEDILNMANAAASFAPFANTTWIRQDSNLHRGGQPVARTSAPLRTAIVLLILFLEPLTWIGRESNPRH